MGEKIKFFCSFGFFVEDALSEVGKKRSWAELTSNTFYIKLTTGNKIVRSHNHFLEKLKTEHELQREFSGRNHHRNYTLTYGLIYVVIFGVECNQI